MPIMAIMDMAWPTTGTVMVWLIMGTATLATLIMATTMARGLLMLSPLPRPMPFMVPMVTMVWATTVWVTGPTDMATLTLIIMATTTARGLLMLSPLLTHSTDITTDMLHMVMPGVTSATRTDTSATTDITKLLLFCSRI